MIYQNLVFIRLVSILASKSPLSPATGGFTVTPEISKVHWDHDLMIPGMFESMFEAKNQLVEPPGKPLEYRYFEDFSIGNTYERCSHIPSRDEYPPVN